MPLTLDEMATKKLSLDDMAKPISLDQMASTPQFELSENIDLGTRPEILQIQRPFDPSEPPDFTKPGIEYPLAEKLFTRPALAGIEAAVPGGRRAILGLGGMQPGVDAAELQAWAGKIEKLPWYKKLPEFAGWLPEKVIEYQTLKGLFKALGLTKALGAAGKKLASAVVGKELARIGGKEALKKGGWDLFRRNVLRSFLQSAPENAAFLAAWRAADSAKSYPREQQILKESQFYVKELTDAFFNEPPGPKRKKIQDELNKALKQNYKITQEYERSFPEAVVTGAYKGARLGVAFSLGVPLIVEGAKLGLDARVIQKALLKFQTKHPKITDKILGDVEQEFIDDVMRIKNAEKGGPAVKFTDLPKQAQAGMKWLARRWRGILREEARRQATAKAYRAAPGPKAGAIEQAKPIYIRPEGLPKKPPIVTPPPKAPEGVSKVTKPDESGLSAKSGLKPPAEGKVEKAIERVAKKLEEGKYKGKIQAADYANVGIQRFLIEKMANDLRIAEIDLKKLVPIKITEQEGWNLPTEPTIDEFKAAIPRIKRYADLNEKRWQAYKRGDYEEATSYRKQIDDLLAQPPAAKEVAMREDKIAKAKGKISIQDKAIEAREAELIEKPPPQFLKDLGIKVQKAVETGKGKVAGVPLRGPVTVSGKKYHPVQLPTEAIGVDPEKFQFKLGAKLTGGVTEALKDVEQFHPVKGGNILVWQDKSGQHWVVDGHHRVALANKTGQPTMDAWVLREVDGVSASDARGLGALNNLADGKGTAVDAAKLFRDLNITIDELKKEAVPTNSTIVQQGLAMKDLSEEVFRLVIDERIPANYAAVIGKNVKGPVQQKQVADLILQGDVDSVRQAELLAITIDNAPVLTKSEMTLFGLETTEKSLYAERAKILANVEKKLKTNKKVFGTLSGQVKLIEEKGNILAREENIRAKERADEVLYLLEKFATLKGPVAEALNNATKEYSQNPTKENLAKVTNDLVQKWMEATTGLSIQDIARVRGAPSERAEKPVEKPKGKPGFIDVTPLATAHKVFMNIIEPSKAVEIKHGGDVYAKVIKGIHKADVARIEFNEMEIANIEGSLNDLAESLSEYPKKVLENLMLSRGHPKDKAAISIQNEAMTELAHEAPELVGLRKTIQKVADSNYDYLKKVVGDEINYVEEYFYGIYKDSSKVDKFLKYWKTTKRFTKEKKLPTYADARAYGLEIRNPNPIYNLMSEYMAIARLEGMIDMRDALLKTGKDVYIGEFIKSPPEWEEIHDPVFKGLVAEPELARMINSLISTNKITRHKILNPIRQTNNLLRNVKFIGSAFHMMVIAKQALADSGYLGFLHKKTATRGLTKGFKKHDPIFKTPEYRKYVGLGGGHRYSIASEAQRMLSDWVKKLNKSKFGRAAGRAMVPVRIPESFVRWMFESYIPKVKYAKYLDTVARQEKKLGRQLSDAEHIEIIKESQNFYGMMNERLFGRSGTVTTLLRFPFMAPGFAEGNYRTMLKAVLQWGRGEGARASRSRANIINSWIVSAAAATIGTLIFTGKPPEIPKSRRDVRDLFKIDTGHKDLQGRKIMIDMLTYDNDYWKFFGNIATGQFDKAFYENWRRMGGMVSTTASVGVDLAKIAAGEALVDYRQNRIVDITDPFLRKVMKIFVYEAAKAEPISVSVFRQARKKDLDTGIAAVTALAGVKLTKTEADKREQEILSKIFSLYDQQERLYYYLGTIKNPRKHIYRYNQTVRRILDNKITPHRLKLEYEPKLIIDTQRLLENKVYYLSQRNRKPDEIKKARKYLENFGVTPKEAQLYLQRYWERQRKKPARTVESIPVIGRNIKKKRLAERYK